MDGWAVPTSVGSLPYHGAPAWLLGRTWLFIALSVLIVGAEIVPESLNLLHRDDAFLLQAALRMLDGARLYVDVIEINPPLIIWLNLIPAGLSRLLHVPPVPVFRICVLALLLGCLALCQVPLKHLLGRHGAVARRAVTLLLLFALFPLIGGNYGQREHLIFALILPYVCLSACRAERLAVPTAAAVSIGTLAGVGMAIKPHFFAAWAALEGWLLLRERGLRWHPENAGILAVAVLYPLAVLAWTPDYLHIVHLLGAWKLEYLRKPLRALTVDRVEFWLVGVAAVGTIVLRRHTRCRPLWEVLSLASLACLLATLVQQKGFTYHYYPALALATVVLGGLALNARVSSSSIERVGWIGVIVAALGVGAMTSRTMAHRLAEGRHWRESDAGRLITFIEATPDIERVFLLSSGLGESVVASHAGVRPVSTLMHLGPLRVAYDSEVRSSAPLRYHTAAEMASLERYVHQVVVEDFRRADPLLLVVSRPGPDQPERGLMGFASERFDYIEYFTQDDAFRRLFEHYTFVGRFGGYHVYRPLRPGERRVSSPPRPAPTDTAVAREQP